MMAFYSLPVFSDALRRQVSEVDRRLNAMDSIQTGKISLPDRDKEVGCLKWRRRHKGSPHHPTPQYRQTAWRFSAY